MRIARFATPVILVIVALGARVAPASAASLFTAAVGSSSDQNAVAAAASDGVTDDYSTGSWTGAAAADALSGAGAQLVLSVANDATYAFVCGQNVCTFVNASASTSDIVRIMPTTAAPVGTPVDISFEVTLDGSIVGNGGWYFLASGNVGTGAGFSYSDGTGGTVGSYNLTVHQSGSFTRTLLVGSDYSLDTGLAIQGLMRGFGAEPFGIDIDFLDTLKIQGTVLTGGVGPLELLGDSGRDYLLAPVPGPATGWLLATAVGAIAPLRAAGRRRAACFMTCSGRTS